MMCIVCGSKFGDGTFNGCQTTLTLGLNESTVSHHMDLQGCGLLESFVGEAFRSFWSEEQRDVPKLVEIGSEIS